MTRFGQCLILITTVVALNATAQQVTKRVLVPVTSAALPGANGSVWETRIWVSNRGTRSAVISPAACLGPILCGSGLPLNSTDLPARFIAAANIATGLLAQITTLPGADVVLSARLRDLSHANDSAGTALPIVPEEEFTDRPLTLIDVPTLYTGRTMLRVYALPEAPEPREVEVRYYRIPEPGDELRVLLRTDRLRLDVPARQHVAPEYLAAYGQIGAIEFLPELFLGQSTWIEVVPVTPGLRIWALVSVTNNTTQQVTLVTPMSR
jgi:hypothetical protein